MHRSSTRLSLVERKVKTPAELIRLISRLKKEGKKIILATGCFDILHSGHIDLFRRARHYGDILIVGANTDRTIRLLKGAGRPVVKQPGRLRNLAAIEYIDAVTWFPERTPRELVRALRPDVFVKGGDWLGKRLPEQDALEEYGGRLIRLPVRMHTSTSAIAANKKIRPSA